MPLELSDKQRADIRAANSRLNIWEGAVRSGKTWGSIIRFARFVGREADENADLLMLGRTERSVYRNVIKPMEMLFGGDSCRYIFGRGELRLFDRVIHVLGANDERSEGRIRGMTAGGSYGDELTLWPTSVFKMMLSRLSTDSAKFFGSTNPDNPYHWLKTEYIDRAAELDMSVFHYVLDDNPFISDKFKDNLKKEYRGLWYKRFIEGLWVMAEGAVYDFFDDTRHVIPAADLPKASSYAVAIDYGTGAPTAMLLFGMNPETTPRVWCEREYYFSSADAGHQKTDADYSADLKKFLGPVQPFCIIVDPSAASLKVQLQRDGFMFIRDAENSVIDGIRTQSRMLASGEYAISSACPRTIMDYAAYLWDIKEQKKGIDKPLKQNDHTKDTERYLLYTLFGENVIDYSLLTRS